MNFLYYDFQLNGNDIIAVALDTVVNVQILDSANFLL